MSQPAIDIATHQSPESSATSILIVEREGATAPEVMRCLRAQGVSVDWIDTGKMALRMLAQKRYALAIIDSDVDGKKGMQLLEEMLLHSAELSVVITTAAASVKHAVTAMQKGAADYLMKPVRAEALETCVRRLLFSQKAPRSPDSGVPGSSQPFITGSQSVKQILESGRAVAGSQATVLITGESGTGKEVLACYIHRHAGRANAPYVAVNCAALPETLMESELFGYEKGAFTGAIHRKIGKFEQAGHGTLVLDEISEMPLPLQAKLLRVLQERRIDRIGGNRQVPFAAQVVAISNRDLADQVRKGQLREDLYYRINVVPLHLPPLRERREDIPLLIGHFMQRYSTMYQRKAIEIDTATMAHLEAHIWKGNIRELENYIERAVLMGALPPLSEHVDTAQPGNTPDSTDLAIRPGLSVRAVEEALIKQTLHEVNDHRERAAKMLGISVRTLRNKLNEYRNRTEPRLEKEAS
jgi:two-component system, NtrC family, response regulator AtoC